MYAAVCCSVLQCVAVDCSGLQCVAVCCSVLQRVTVDCSGLQWIAVDSVSQEGFRQIPIRNLRFRLLGDMESREKERELGKRKGIEGLRRENGREKEKERD